MKTHFEVWVLGYDKDDDLTDIDEQVGGEFKSLDEAKEFASELQTNSQVEAKLREQYPETPEYAFDDVSYYNVCVEEIDDANPDEVYDTHLDIYAEPEYKTVKVEFYARMNKADIKAMNKYFADAMSESMDINEVWGVKCEEVNEEEEA